MAQPPKDPTFRGYNTAQAQAYVQGRGTYPPALYELVLSHHISTGGSTDTLIEIGTGPGNALRPMALSFTHAYGLDPGPAMIETARSLGGSTKTGEPIKWESSTAEDLNTSTGIPDGSVDMIMAATAAHWFDMPAFWTRAAALLKPHGTVALWSGASVFCHPDTPNAKKIQAILNQLEDEELDKFHVQGNRLTRGMYLDLPLPWQVDPPNAAFDEKTFFRKEWNRDGKLEPGEADFFLGRENMTVDLLVKGLATSSSVTRWREANPEKAGTDEDCVKIMGRRMKEALKEVGADENGVFKGGVASALLMVKRV
jgi:trans-aconitate 3-methyltransferase